ncbi:hypothetical protein bcgnr5390_12570 [Bacillus luti]|nr:hypothetical protein BC2903_51250 [Bacillus cereus]
MKNLETIYVLAVFSIVTFVLIFIPNNFSAYVICLLLSLPILYLVFFDEETNGIFDSIKKKTCRTLIGLATISEIQQLTTGLFF